MKTIVDLNRKVHEIEDHVRNYLDQEYLRSWLYKNNYMFFIGDGSILPRESSISEKPMKNAIPFKSPETLRVKITLPRVVSGMAVPIGLLVVTGGGYHGKTTLLEAIQEGIYDHVIGDGRELVVSRKYTILVKAEDGRIVSQVDISSFIENLPSGTDTRKFSSLDSSGSTSMAASISEAIEANAEVLLIDEDTSATNLLFKDELMSKIIKEEPIKPLCMQIKDLIRKTGIGVVLVSSASSTYLNIADNIVLMERYIPKDITSNVKPSSTCLQHLEFKPPRNRIFYGIKGLKRIRSRGFKIVAEYEDNTRFELDLTYYPRVVEKGQVKLITNIIKHLVKPQKPLKVPEIIRYINEVLDSRGFEAFIKPVPPDLTWVDGFDVVWVLNRLYNAVFKII